jgi:hypothetical protein
MFVIMIRGSNEVKEFFKISLRGLLAWSDLVEYIYRRHGSLGPTFFKFLFSGRQYRVFICCSHLVVSLPPRTDQDGTSRSEC